MDVQTWDSVFIRSTRHALHPVIADLARWPQWWPGMSVVPGSHGYALRLRRPGLLARRRRWMAQETEHRPDLGIRVHYDGVLAGEAEFFYLDERAGTVVHYVLRGVVPDRGWRAAVRDHRAGVRAGLDALKDRFEHGREPGAEPTAQLLADQRQAMAEFAENVAAWERKNAAEVQP